MSGTTIPKAPGSLPFLGHSAALLRDPLRFLATIANAGPLHMVHLGPFRAIAVCDPELARHVFVNDRVFDKGGRIFDLVKEVTGHRSMVVMGRDEHRSRRRTVQPAFHPGRFPEYTTVMLEQIDTVMDSWQDGETIDLYEEMKQVTARVGLLTMFSYMQPEWIISRTLDDSITIMNGIFRRIVSPAVVNRLPTPGNLRYQRANARMRVVVDRIIDEYREQGVDRGDLLSVLLDAGPVGVGPDEPSDAAGRPEISDVDVHDEVTVFFLAAMDTTAACIAWTLTELMRHPETHRRVREEIETELGGRRVTAADLRRLPYTAQVVSESLRLHPPVWLLTRNVTADTELAGHHVGAGSEVLLSPYLLHQREEVFPDAGTFDPDRWADPGLTKQTREALMPFGGGARRCIGEAFAMTEVLLALARIVPTWALEPREGAEVRSSLSFVLSPRRSTATLRRIG